MLELLAYELGVLQSVLRAFHSLALAVHVGASIRAFRLMFVLWLLLGRLIG
jgi:hypothetical protein